MAHRLRTIVAVTIALALFAVALLVWPGGTEHIAPAVTALPAPIQAGRADTLAGQASAAPPSTTRIDSIRPEDIADFPDYAVGMSASPKPPTESALTALVTPQVTNLYEDVGAAIGLPDEQHRRLVELLIRQHVAGILIEYQEEPDAGKLEALEDAMHERHRRELHDLLGIAALEAFDRYREAMEPRYEVEHLRELFEFTNLPLTESQRRDMMLAVLQPGVFVPRRGYQESEGPEAVRQQVRARVERNDQQLKAAAQSILTPEQWAEYSTYLDDRRAEAVLAQTPRFAREKRDDE